MPTYLITALVVAGLFVLLVRLYGGAQRGLGKAEENERVREDAATRRRAADDARAKPLRSPRELIEWVRKRARDGKDMATLSGRPPEPGFEGLNRGAPAGIDPATGMHRDYWVLPEEERKKGFVRPVRRTYVHAKCGRATTMGLALAATYARDPKYYGATFCVGCRTHFPVSEFTWDDGSVVGS